VASHLALKIPDRQAILETTVVTERLEKVLGHCTLTPWSTISMASQPATSNTASRL
jgi:hypothetical protein